MTADDLAARAGIPAAEVRAIVHAEADSLLIAALKPIVDAAIEVIDGLPNLATGRLERRILLSVSKTARNDFLNTLRAKALTIEAIERAMKP